MIWCAILLSIPLSAVGSTLQDSWVRNSTYFDVHNHGWPFENDTHEFQVFAESTFLEISPEWSVCGGMSLSAKKRFLTGVLNSDFSESVRQELIDNQWESVGGKVPEVGAKFLQWMERPDHPHTLSMNTIGFKTREEWPRIQASIDNGFPVVLGLVLVGPPGSLLKVGENHQVLAIGYSVKGDSVRIDVYDPNQPHKLARIDANFGSLHPLDVKYSDPWIAASGKRVRGFFVIHAGPLCFLCDCTQWVFGTCLKWLDEPSWAPRGSRHLKGRQLTPPAAFFVPISY